MNRTVAELAALVEGQVVGDGALIVTGVANLDNAGEGDIIFVDNAKYFERALASPAIAIVAPKSLSTDQKTLIQVRNPKLAFARIVAELKIQPQPFQGIHATAIVAKTVAIGENIAIGAYAVIGENTHIGNNVRIGVGCAIGNDVEIGNDVTIHANVTLYDRVKLRDRVIVHANTVIGSDGFGYIFDGGKYHKFPQIGDVIVAEDVEIGSNVSIDRGALGSTIIGRGSKIDNLCQIGHNVRVGENVVMAAQVGISGSAVIEDNAILGGQVGIADHVKIERGAIVGAQGGVPSGKIIRKGLTVWGTPARDINEFKHIYAHTQQLPKLKDRLVELEKKVAELMKKDKVNE